MRKRCLHDHDISLSLAFFRHKAGLRQKDVAEVLGVRQTAVSSWEANIAQPSLANLIQLCDLYQVSLDELCCNNGKEGENVTEERMRELIGQLNERERALLFVLLAKRAQHLRG